LTCFSPEDDQSFVVLLKVAGFVSYVRACVWVCCTTIVLRVPVVYVLLLPEVVCGLFHKTGKPLFCLLLFILPD
jgi:hypothetical protein